MIWIYVCVRMCVCMYVCMCEYARTRAHTHTHTHSLIHIHTQVLAFEAGIFTREAFLVLVTSTLVSVVLCCFLAQKILSIYHVLMPIFEYLDAPIGREKAHILKCPLYSALTQVIREDNDFLSMLCDAPGTREDVSQCRRLQQSCCYSWME